MKRGTSAFTAPAPVALIVALIATPTALSAVGSNTTTASTRNPFRYVEIVATPVQPTPTTARPAPSNEPLFLVQGIAQLEQPVALIDGQWLRVGATVQGFHLHSISTDHIVVTRKARTYTLPLHPDRDT